MAVYKVIQDIEAEDKLLGPLTLKQFIFAVIAAGFIFVAFLVVTKTGNLFVAIPFIPFIAIPAILAAPLGRDQPTDIWLAAQIRFFVKPRKRIWDQSGIKNLVTITVPKRIEKIYSDGLSQQEVRSRLKALADTIDSRGWAVKNVDINMFSTPSYAMVSDDRLIDPSSLPQTVSSTDVTAADDIMDAYSNPVAQHFDTLVQEATIAQKAAAIDHMKAAMSNPVLAAQQVSPPTPVDPWFLHQQNQAQAEPGSAMFSAQTVAPASQRINDDDTFLREKTATSDDSTADEQALLAHIKEEKQQEKQSWTHHKTIKTPEEIAEDEAARQEQEQEQQAQAVTPPKNPGIVELANTNDLSVASVAHIANRKSQSNDGEVVIKLH
jgi:hypothetical protein